jgi:hypothetical protein
MGLFGEAAAALGSGVEAGEVFARLMPLALDGDADAGGLVSIPYVSGEHVTGFGEGRPLFVRGSGAAFTLKNFIRAHLFSALAAMRTGLDILTKDEGVQVEEIRGHGGFFKTPGVGQRIMAAATNSRCSVMETAGEVAPGEWRSSRRICCGRAGISPCRTTSMASSPEARAAPSSPIRRTSPDLRRTLRGIPPYLGRNAPRWTRWRRRRGEATRCGHCSTGTVGSRA